MRLGYLGKPCLESVVFTKRRLTRHILHQPEHSLVVHRKVPAFKLGGDPAVTVAGKLQTDGFNLARKICLRFTRPALGWK